MKVSPNNRTTPCAPTRRRDPQTRPRRRPDTRRLRPQTARRDRDQRLLRDRRREAPQEGDHPDLEPRAGRVADHDERRLLAQSAVDRLTLGAHTLLIEGPSTDNDAPTGAPPFTSRAKPSDAHPHLQVVHARGNEAVPSPWQATVRASIGVRSHEQNQVHSIGVEGSRIYSATFHLRYAGASRDLGRWTGEIGVWCNRIHRGSKHPRGKGTGHQGPQWNKGLSL